MNNSWNKIWNAIHIIGKTFNPDNELARESFVGFFVCLADLLPNIPARESLSSFIWQQPVERFISSSDTAFEWTYRLHSYINTIKRRQGQLSSDITIEQAYKKYSNINKTDWSRAIWFLMHYISANLPSRLSADQAEAFTAFIVCLRYLLPCQECRNHMNDYITDTQLGPCLRTNKDVFEWTWKFHNSVNTRIGKTQWTWEEFHNRQPDKREQQHVITMEEAFNIYRIKEPKYTMIDY